MRSRPSLLPGARREAAALVDALRRAVDDGALGRALRPGRRGCPRTRPSSSGRSRRPASPSASVPPFRSGRTSPAGWASLWAGLAARGASGRGRGLAPQAAAPARVSGSSAVVDPLPLLRRAGVRDAVLGAEGAASAYEVRLTAYAGRRREVGDGREAERAERLGEAVRRLLGVAARIPSRARLPEMLEAWRAGLDVAGFWTALEREPLEEDARARRASAREAAAVEVWRAFVRDIRAGWKAARMRGAGDGPGPVRPLAPRRGREPARLHRPWGPRRSGRAPARGAGPAPVRLPRRRRARCGEPSPACRAGPARRRGAAGDPRRARARGRPLAGRERRRPGRLARPSTGGGWAGRWPPPSEWSSPGAGPREARRPTWSSGSSR